MLTPFSLHSHSTRPSPRPHPLPLLHVIVLVILFLRLLLRTSSTLLSFLIATRSSRDSRETPGHPRVFPFPSKVGPWTSPRVRFDRTFEGNPEVATRSLLEVAKKSQKPRPPNLASRPSSSSPLSCFLLCHSDPAVADWRTGGCRTKSFRAGSFFDGLGPVEGPRKPNVAEKIPSDVRRSFFALESWIVF